MVRDMKLLWGRLAVLLAGVLLPLALFGMLAEEFAEKESFSFDRPILLFVHAHATPFLDSVMYWITEAGSAFVLVPAMALVSAWLLKHKRPNEAAFWACSVVGAALINFAAKNRKRHAEPRCERPAAQVQALNHGLQGRNRRRAPCAAA